MSDETITLKQIYAGWDVYRELSGRGGGAAHPGAVGATTGGQPAQRL